MERRLKKREELKMQLTSWWTAEDITPTSDDEAADWYDTEHATHNVSAEHATQNVSAEHVTQHAVEHAIQHVSVKHATQHVSAEYATQHDFAEHATQHNIADGYTTRGNVTRSAARLAQLNATAVHSNRNTGTQGREHTGT